jgi:hypothetical protein
MDRQAIDVHGRIAFSNAERKCALPKMGSKAPMAERLVVVPSGHLRRELELAFCQPNEGCL